MLTGMHDVLLASRDKFPIRASKTYMIRNSPGAMPASVRDLPMAEADLEAPEGRVAQLKDLRVRGGTSY